MSCPQLYLQVQGMLQLQAVKLLILQLEEILTVGKALRQLWEVTKQSEDCKQNPELTGGDSSLTIISMFSRGKNRRMTVFQGIGNNNPTHICYFHLQNCEVGNALVLIHL